MRDRDGEAGAGTTGAEGSEADTSGDVSAANESSGETETEGSSTGATGPEPTGTMRTELAGHSLAAYPHFRVVQIFNDDEGWRSLRASSRATSGSSPTRAPMRGKATAR